MSLLKENTLRIVLYEGAGASELPADERFEIMSALLGKGYTVTRSGRNGRVAPADRSSVVALGRFEDGQAPEAEDAAGEVELRFEDINGRSPAELAERVDAIREETQTSKHGEWKPWFPVIDYDNCTNCMQCLSFCLFDVYGVDDDKQIEVQNNDNCKTNCPACSRVCPEAAIMFPKYKSGPINGDTVSSADMQREKMKVDISSLLGGDVYHTLRQRSERAKSRFSKERSSDKALGERKKCLTKLAQSGDIPMEVLMSLPSPEEIAERAEVAAAKGQAALDAQQS